MFDISSPFVSGLFSYFSSIFSSFIGSGLLADSLSLLFSLVVFVILLSILITVFSYTFGWAERKIIARAHSRRGPTYVGRYGILQNLADVLKLISKENIIPDSADKPLFVIMLPIIYAIFIIILAFIPLNSVFVGINSSLGLLAIFIILSFTPLLLFLVAWTSGNKFSSISAQRSVVILISYEIPLILVVVAIALLANSFSLTNIISAQQNLWFAFLMPIGFIIFFIVLMAELERPPFDLREADSELIAGWLTDVSAPFYAVALFLDYTRVFVGSLLVVTLFFGGWLGPGFIPPFISLMAKVVAVTLFVIFLRATTVRMRIDRVLRLGWLYLMPLAVVNLLITFLIFIK